MLQRIIALLTLAFGFLAPAHALDDYAVLSRASFEINPESDLSGVEGEGFLLTYGVRLSEVMSFELSIGHHDLEDGGRRVSFGEMDGALTLEGSINTGEFALLFQRRAGNISPFLIFGHLTVDNEDIIAVFDPDNGPEMRAGGSQDGQGGEVESSDLFAGFGIDIHFGDAPYGIRAAYKSVGNEIDGEFLSVGAVLKF